MRITLALVFAMATCFSANCWGQQSAAELCVKDLEAIPGFLLENDTGAKDHLAQLGQKHFDDAFVAAKAAAMQVPDAAACQQVLTRYLKAWRKGHLGLQNLVVPAAPTAAGDSPGASAAASRKDEPAIRVLSGKTILLTLKSFEDHTREPLIALLKRDHEELATHPNWIIDLRGNGGGSDSSYEPLLGWLMPDESVSVGAMWLVTPANIQGQMRRCAIVSPGDSVCEKFANEAVTRMRNGTTGSYVAQDDTGDITFERITPLEPRRPSRVAILIDGDCGSSCEEFLLAARQSFNVKLIGRRTFGSLDYSNLRPHDLPSGQRRLWYATSRSLRIPDLPVDLAGIPPDIYLPLAKGDHAKDEEVRRVQSWLEGGSLALGKTGTDRKDLGRH